MIIWQTHKDPIPKLRLAAITIMDPRENYAIETQVSDPLLICIRDPALMDSAFDGLDNPYDVGYIVRYSEVRNGQRTDGPLGYWLHKGIVLFDSRQADDIIYCILSKCKKIGG